MSDNRIVLELKNEEGELIDTVELPEDLSSQIMDMYDGSEADEEEFFSNLISEALRIFQKSRDM